MCNNRSICLTDPFRLHLITALCKIRTILSAVEAGIASHRDLHLHLEHKPGTGQAAEVLASGWSSYYPERIYFNTAEGKYENFFELTPQIEVNRLLHEMTHFTSTGDTDDDSNGLSIWKSGPFYENFPYEDLNDWGTILLREITAKTGKKGCPSPPWPH
jgi:hypothetical protein